MTAAALALALPGISWPAFSQVDPSPAGDRGTVVDPVTRHRLAVELVRYGNDIIGTLPVSTRSINIAKYFYEQAASFAPDDPEISSRLLEIALVAEDDQLIDSATRQLLNASPANQLAQLRRLMSAIDRFQTAEDRIRSYEILLSPENQEALGEILSSRLAFQLAMLHRRMGDIDQFSHWLGQSIALDPSYSEAIAMGAGFFQTRAGDKIANVELLVSLLLADPTDSTTPAVLANMLMQSGAYESARRMYFLSARDITADKSVPSSDMLADLALAEWASGDRDRALATIQARQQEMDAYYRSLTRQEAPDLSPIDLARMEAPLTPTLATVRAVVASSADADTARDAMSSAIESYENALQILATQEGTQKEQASALLEMAWLSLWLGGDVEKAEAWILQAQQLQELDPDAHARFDGWVQLRRGFDEDAMRSLTPLEEKDPVARLGLAVILEQQGKMQDAARKYLEVARSQPGTVIGIWSAERLSGILGTPLPMTEEAEKMTAIIANIPTVIDRYPDDPRLAISIDIEPAAQNIKPYEPVIINIELANNTPMPLAISPDGPINELILIEPVVQIPYQKALTFGPIVFDIAHRLRLEPYERITIPFDLRTVWVGLLLNLHPYQGATVMTTGILNFTASNNNMNLKTVFAPGLLGSEVTGTPLRVEGVRISEEWATGVISSSLEGSINSDDLTGLAILSVVAGSNTGTMTTDPIPEDLAQKSLATIFQLFPTFDPVQQAWFLCVMSRSDLLDPVRSMASRDGDQLVKAIRLVRLMESGDLSLLRDDPTLMSSLRSEDATIRQLAEWIEERIDILVEKQILEKGGGATGE